MTAIAAPRKVLLLKPCCIGDVLLATPLASALRTAWPGAAIDWAVDVHSRAALAGNPSVDRLLDATGAVRGALDPWRLARLARETRAVGYDAVFVPDRSPLLALLALLTGAPLRVGLDSGGRGRPYTVRVRVGDVTHESELYLELARSIGLEVPPASPVFVPSADDRAAATAVLADRPDGGPPVAVHPGGGVNPGMSLEEKRWPAPRYAALIDRLVSDLGADVVLLGGEDDRGVAAAVSGLVSPRARSRLTDLSGCLSLGETAAVIAACRLYVGNDSGIAHLASAVGTPTVVVFGPTDPRRYGPSPEAGVAVAPLDAPPVDRLSAARGSRAVESVPVDAVWAGVSKALLLGTGLGRP